MVRLLNWAVVLKCQDRRSRCRPFYPSPVARVFSATAIYGRCVITQPQRLDGRKSWVIPHLVFFWLLHDGGYAGGQAEYARVPFADTGLFKIPDDQQTIKFCFYRYFPYRYMAAENCEVQMLLQFGVVSPSDSWD